MFIGIFALTGLFVHNNFLKSVYPTDVSMKFNVALSFILSSIVLLLDHFSRKNKTLHFFSKLISVLIILIGLITLAEYISGINIGIDELFVRDDLGITAVHYAGRMPPFSTISFLLIGIGLFLLNKEKALTYHLFYLSGIACASVIMLIGLNFVSDVPAFIQIAPHAGIGFITLSIAIWFAQPMLQRKISFERKLFFGFTAVIILIAITCIFFAYYNARHISTSKWINHTNLVLKEEEQTLSLIKDIESGRQGYILTGDSVYLENFTIAKNTIFNHIKTLKELTQDNPAQQVRIDSLSALVDKRIAFSLQCIQLRNEKEFQATNALKTTGLGKPYSDKIWDVASAIREEENNLLTRRQKEYDKSITSFNLAFLVFLAGVFILLAIILFSIRNNIAIRKKSEEQKEFDSNNFKALINNTDDLMWSVDKDLKLITFNESFNKAIEIKSGKKLAKGDDILSIQFTEDEMKRYKIFYERALGGETFTVVDRFDHPFEYWSEISFHPIRNGNLVIGTACFSRDLTEHKAAEENLRALEQKILNQKIEEQKTITRAIIKAQETERNYIGRELHDNVTQILAGAKLYLGMAGNNDAKAKEAIQYPLELIGASIKELQSLSSKMVTPLKDINLAELVQTLLIDLNETTLIKTVFVYDVSGQDIDRDLKLNIYRIVQEQVNNIIKYAEAKNVSISIEADQQKIRIIVADDGIGFDVNKKRKGIGISNMINRVESFNGELVIESSPGNGCTIRVNIPRVDQL